MKTIYIFRVYKTKELMYGTFEIQNNILFIISNNKKYIMEDIEVLAEKGRVRL